MGNRSGRGRAPPGEATPPSQAGPGARARPPRSATLGTRGHHTPHPAARSTGPAREPPGSPHPRSWTPSRSGNDNTGARANLGAFIWPATRVPRRRRALGAPAPSAIRRAQARLRVPGRDLPVPRVTWAHPFTLGTVPGNTRDLGVPPAVSPLPEPLRSPGAEWLHLTREKSATRACSGSLSAALSPTPGE